MSKQIAEPKPTPQRGVTPYRRPMLDMPAEVSDDFGLQESNENHMQGVVATDSIAPLLEAFGVQPTEHLSFPFQKFGRNRVGRTSIRIEVPSGHAVKGKMVVGHQWMFRQETPELTA